MKKSIDITARMIIIPHSLENTYTQRSKYVYLQNARWNVGIQG